VLAVPLDELPLDDTTSDLLTRLRCCGDLQAYVLSVTCAGEVDCRIVVRRTRPGTTVELLCPQDADAAPQHWHAVRVVLRGDAPGRVLRFVDDLLGLPPSALRRRYHLLG